MRYDKATARVVSSLLLAGILDGCSKSPESSTQPAAAGGSAPQAASQKASVDFKVERVDLGTAIDASNKITAATTRFKPKDVIYASIVGSGNAPRVTLRVQLYSDKGPLVSDASQFVVPSGPTISEFHLSYPNGWEPGTYKLKVTVDDVPAGSADLTIAE